ncbi:MAG: ABC transporter ATP-binding protein, partial [Variovorax sp.]
RAGEILGVIGPNGAGKSTTFSMIAGALPSSTGSLRFNGEVLDGLPTHAMAARGIMRTFQHNKPFASMSVRENVMVGMHTCIGRSLWRVLAGTPGAAQAEHDAVQRADALVDFVGLAEWRDADVGTLSFGQGRLLEIARGLAAEPRLMMFDEPAAGLTPAECDRLSEIIRNIARRGIAVLLIEHDMRFLMALADRVLVLNFGRRIAQGTPVEVRADKAVVAAYLGDLGAMAHA